MSMEEIMKVVPVAKFRSTENVLGRIMVLIFTIAVTNTYDVVTGRRKDFQCSN